MARKDDLEKFVLNSYQLIREYEKILQFSQDPAEKMRARNKAEERWGLIHHYLEEYLPLCYHLGAEIPEEIFQLGLSIEETAQKIRAMGIERAGYLRFVRPEEIEALRNRIDRLEKALERPESEALREPEDEEFKSEIASGDTDVRRFVLHNGALVRCQPKPFKRSSSVELYLTMDGSHLVKLWRDPEPWREQALRLLVERFNPAQLDPNCRPLLCWPNGIVKSPQLGVRMPHVPPKMRALGWFVFPKARSVLPPEDLGNWRGHVEIAIKIARAARYLHMSGLYHSDLSPNNILVDPRDGSAVLVDLDEVAVPGIMPPSVLGTIGYMAPEIVEGRALPSVGTDLHALAVLIYQILLLRHPLLGPKIHSDDSEEDERLALGRRALYIEHPMDFSNRPMDLMSCAILGPEMQRLFERAFANGLHNPQNRPTAVEWEAALLRMQQEVVACNNPECAYRYFVLTDYVRGQCPWCNPEMRLGIKKGRRLPIYLLLCTSSSLRGAPIQAVNQGVNLIYNELMNNPRAIETAHIAVITFDSQATMVTPLTELTMFSPPTLSAGGARAMGAALQLLRESLDCDIIPDSPDRKGDYKAVVLLMTDGMPTDGDVWKREASTLRNRTKDIATIIALGCGGGEIDVNTLKELTDEVLLMDTITPDQITRYFKWVSQSVRPADLQLPPAGIQVVL